MALKSTIPKAGASSPPAISLDRVVRLRRKASNFRLMTMNLLTLGVLFGVYTFIFPRVMDMLDGMKATLPAITQQLRAIAPVQVQVVLELIAVVLVAKEFAVPSHAVKWTFNLMMWLTLMGLLALLLLAMILPMTQAVRTVTQQ